MTQRTQNVAKNINFGKKNEYLAKNILVKITHFRRK